jgi:hypothetical protein
MLLASQSVFLGIPLPHRVRTTGMTRHDDDLVRLHLLLKTGFSEFMVREVSVMSNDYLMEIFFTNFTKKP